MRIDRINIYSAQLPVKGGVYRMASADVEALDSTLVEIVTTNGLVGWGETCPVGPVYQPHHALGARAAIAEIAPGLIGAEIASIRLPVKCMGEHLNGHGCAKAAFDMAFLDLLGQKLGVPVSTLLGGALADRVPAYYSLIVGPPDETAKIAADKVKAGYPRLQVKIGGARSGRRRRRHPQGLGGGRLHGADRGRRQPGPDGCRRDPSRPALPGDPLRLRAALQHDGGSCDAQRPRQSSGLSRACAHLAATVEPRRMEGAWIAQEYIEGHFDTKNPIVIKQGYIVVPQRPGLGVKPEPGMFGKPIAIYGP